jgi:hypothetical protein
MHTNLVDSNARMTALRSVGGALAMKVSSIRGLQAFRHGEKGERYQTYTCFTEPNDASYAAVVDGMLGEGVGERERLEDYSEVIPHII